MVDDVGEFEHIVVTQSCLDSLNQRDDDSDYEFSLEELDGVEQALHILDDHPADLPGLLRLHPMTRQDRPWWSITPPHPAGTDMRLLLQPSRTATGRGVWILGPLTRHYRRSRPPH